MNKEDEPKLIFSASKIPTLAKCYLKNQKEDKRQEEEALEDLKIQIADRGYLVRKELQQVASWKSPRRPDLVDKNEDKYIEEVTKFAFSTTCERARIEALTLLDGVAWPTASSILHLFHEDPYPILDFRALESVSLKVPSQYSFDFWWQYVEFCRETARAAAVDMRTLDRALWQYSKDKQPIN